MRCGRSPRENGEPSGRAPRRGHASSAAIRFFAEASSSASTLGMPSRTPASTRTCAFHRHNVAGEIPVSAAISATGSPARSRALTCRRIASEKDFGIVTSGGSVCHNSRNRGPLSGGQIIPSGVVSSAAFAKVQQFFPANDASRPRTYNRAWARGSARTGPSPPRTDHQAQPPRRPDPDRSTHPQLLHRIVLG